MYFERWPFRYRELKAGGAMSEPSDRAPLLDVRQLEVVYHDVATAIQGISIEVAPGSIVAMVGTNGAGKTTTLRAISGFLPAEDVAVTEGAISLTGNRCAGCCRIKFPGSAPCWCRSGKSCSRLLLFGKIWISA